MISEFYIKLVVTAITAVVGWVVAHWLSDRRAATSKKREFVLDYLVKAFSEVEQAIEPNEITKEWFYNLGSALHKIQLFGSKKQIELVQEIFEVMKVKTNLFPNDKLIELLRLLRNDLRAELKLEPIDNSVVLLRLGEKITSNKKSQSDA